MGETFAEQIHRIRDTSGLTWPQLARLFGVATRTVHGWATGFNPNTRHRKFADTIDAAVAALHGSPEQRRAAMFTYGRDGTPSPYNRLLQQQFAQRGPELHPNLWPFIAGIEAARNERQERQNNE